MDLRNKYLIHNIALAIIELVIAGKPGGNFFHGKNINFGIPYYTITIAFNIFVTLFIVIRLRRLGSAVSRALGKDSARMYTSISSMLVESAAPYSLVGIMFLIPYGLGNGIAISFGQVWAKLAVRFISSPTHIRAFLIHLFLSTVFGSSVDRPPRCHRESLGTRNHHTSPKQRRIHSQATRPRFWHRNATIRCIQSWRNHFGRQRY